MKIPLSLIIGAFGVSLDFISKSLVVLMGVPVVWHETTGETMYLYTSSGLELFTRDALIWQVLVGFVFLVLLIVLSERVVFKSRPKTRFLAQILAGVMIVPFVQEVLALFAPVPNFIPAHTYMMFIFYENMWSVATIGDFARSFGIVAWIVMLIVWMWEEHTISKKNGIILNQVYP